MKTHSKKEIQAVGYFMAERMQHGENFDAALCIEDIHRMHGKQIADWMEESSKTHICKTILKI